MKFQKIKNSKSLFLVHFRFINLPNYLFIYIVSFKKIFRINSTKN